jgi:hypothetical protein
MKLVITYRNDSNKMERREQEFPEYIFSFDFDFWTMLHFTQSIINNKHYTDYEQKSLACQLYHHNTGTKKLTQVILNFFLFAVLEIEPMACVC